MIIDIKFTKINLLNSLNNQRQNLFIQCEWEEMSQNKILL